MKPQAGVAPIGSDSEKWSAMTVSYDRQDIEADRSDSRS